MDLNQILQLSQLLFGIISPFIPSLLPEKRVSKKRLEKIANSLKPEIIAQIEKYHADNQCGMLSEVEYVKYLNIQNIFKDSFLDLESDDELKKKLLNEEIKEIFDKNSYKYVYNKVTGQDLYVLKLIGDSWTKWFNIVLKNKTNDALSFFPTVTLINPDSISIGDSFKKSKSTNSIKNTIISLYNIFDYNNCDVSSILSRYNKYFENIFNLINLGLLIYEMDDNLIVPSIDIRELDYVKPFALALTKKGKDIYESIK